jgi:hypothetical protein
MTKNIPKFVDGPLNIAHLRGNIDGINKDIYLLFDIHSSIDKQTNCNDYKIKDAMSIEEFIDNICKNATTDKPVDFMLEMFLSHLFSQYPNEKKGHIYINRLRIFMQKNFTLNQKETMIINSKKYPNARLHYIDIRDAFMELIDYFYLLRTTYSKKTHDEHIKNNSWEQIKPKITKIYNRVKKLQLFLLNGTNGEKIKKYKFLKIYSKKTTNSIKITEQMNMLKYIIKKVRSKCKHESVKNIIEFIINNELVKCFNELTDKYNLLIKTSDSNIFFIILSHFYTQILNYSVFLMDIYAIRRVLDKDYITKAFLYIGYDHANHYMMILMNHMNFDLINISKNKLLSLNELKEKIHKVKEYKNIGKYNVPKNGNIAIQCTDYSMFPNIIN